METLALLGTLHAKPGKEQAVEDFLKSALPLATAEPETIRWYALKLGPAKFGIFDTFAAEEGRKAHVNGDIAKALFAQAEELFAAPPQIEFVEILAAKNPGA